MVIVFLFLFFLLPILFHLCYLFLFVLVSLMLKVSPKSLVIFILNRYFLMYCLNYPVVSFTIFLRCMFGFPRDYSYHLNLFRLISTTYQINISFLSVAYKSFAPYFILYICVCVYIYIYTQREREREIVREGFVYMCVYICICMYMCMFGRVCNLPLY